MPVTDKAPIIKARTIEGLRLDAERSRLLVEIAIYDVMRLLVGTLGMYGFLIILWSIAKWAVSIFT